MEGQPGGAGDAELWVRARDILDRALSLPEASRASYLDQACGADAELRREVESLLAVADRPAFSDRPAPADPGATITMQGAAAAGTPILPGQRISHYQIASKIGEGGMGAVYRAIDTNLGRTVALKVISRPFISADDKRRFAREAKAASALNHANIVTIYEYNSDHGIDFIAMEFVEGSALDKLLKQGGTPLSTLLDYARQVAGALAKAHAAGIAHRDLKPGNIMITGDGVVKVLDFGLAKQSRDTEGGEGTVTMALTQIGAVLGTPSYMSPEQAMGEPADFRSDIFSFGIILYEMVCGRRPFQGSDAQTTLRQIVYKEPSPVEEVNQSLPQDLAALIAECLRKDREQRLQSMGDASERLRSIAEAPAATATATAAPTPAASPSIRFPWRRVAKWSLWAAAGIAIAAGGVRWGPRMIQRTALLAPDSFQQYQKATALLKKKYRKSYLDEAITTLDQAIAANPKHAASYAALAEAYVARYEGANDPQWLKLAADSAQKAAELDPDLSAAQAVVGLTAMVQQSYEKADVALQRALELDPQNARAHEWRGLLFERRKQLDQAEAEYQTALTIAPKDWDSAYQLGRLRYNRQRYPGALEAWERARAESLDNPAVHRSLAAVYHMLGRDEDAAASLQKALEIEPSAAAYNNLGTLRFFQGHYLDAASAFEKAVQMNSSRYLYWGNLGDAYRWAPGERPKAAEAYGHAIQLASELVGKEKDAPGRIGLYKAKSGDTAGALRSLASIPVKDYDGAMHYRAAVINELAGRRDAALASLQAALAGGYSSGEINNDPELLSLRNDVRYRRLTVPPAGATKGK